MGNKEFLETNQLQGIAMKVFKLLHYDLMVKNRNSILSLPKNCLAVSISPKES